MRFGDCLVELLPCLAGGGFLKLLQDPWRRFAWSYVGLRNLVYASWVLLFERKAEAIEPVIEVKEREKK